MIENKSIIKIENSSEKSFSKVFFFVFVIISLIPLINKLAPNYFLLATGFIILLIGYTLPNTLKYPNYIWIKFGILLGHIISPLVMFFIYFFVVFPIGLILKIFKKKTLDINFEKNKVSYWIVQNKTINFKEQF
tara:strand:+ start:310 stop:711 length:402 start_codon:yes stop_codon:yes gene_type:complete